MSLDREALAKELDYPRYSLKNESISYNSDGERMTTTITYYDEEGEYSDPHTNIPAISEDNHKDDTAEQYHYLNGVLHNIHGPAHKCFENGRVVSYEYYFEGEELTFKEWIDRVDSIINYDKKSLDDLRERVKGVVKFRSVYDHGDGHNYLYITNMCENDVMCYDVDSKKFIDIPIWHEYGGAVDHKTFYEVDEDIKL